MSLGTNGFTSWLKISINYSFTESKLIYMDKLHALINPSKINL